MSEVKIRQRTECGLVFVSLEFDMMQSFLSASGEVGEQLRKDCIISNSKE
jgi:hypothetical protein